MSHFTVAVLTRHEQSIEDLLAPFDENIKVEPYIYRTKEDIIREAKKKKEDFLQKMKSDDFELRSYHKEYLNCETDEDFYAVESQYFEEDEMDEDGNELSTYNPKSKWDWWTIGGRWSNLLKTKDGYYTDSCLISELDLTADEESYKQAVRFWELYIEHQPLREGENPARSLYKEEYFTKRYRTKENYAKQQAALATYAVLMPNGEWLEPGKMGWFGFSNANDDAQNEWVDNYKKLLDEAAPNWMITIVDCHI